MERGQGLWHRNGGNRKSVRYQEIADSCSKELGVEEQLAKTSQELELMDRLVVGSMRWAQVSTMSNKAVGAVRKKGWELPWQVRQHYCNFRDYRTC